jgi:hypothetical protein
MAEDDEEAQPASLSLASIDETPQAASSFESYRPQGDVYRGPIPASASLASYYSYQSDRMPAFPPRSSAGPNLFGAPVAHVSAPAPSPMFGSMNKTSDLINSSYAATVAAGREVDTHGHDTEFEYQYNVPSNQTGKLCTVCLSISTKIQFRSSLDNQEVMTAGKLLLPELLTRGAQALLDQYKNVKVYKEENCVLCLDEGADTVFYTCGHQCCHLACAGEKLTKCPICRGHITASLKV